MVAMTKEDMWCMSPFIGYGFVEPSKEWLEAKHRTLLGINPEGRYHKFTRMALSKARKMEKVLQACS
jgi:hypothetical protein